MLTDIELQSFRRLLESEEQDLLARIKVLDRRLQRNGEFNEAADLGDSSFEAFSKEEYLTERNQASVRLVAVKNALRRMDEGTYGYSEISGRPIPLERLEAIPTATTLVDERPFV